ncbi:MATE family efflux transporter [Halioxenophilus aromaticivorans]|uniref:Multidrug-efflux transporter n=1 Tax=Halioxenophilus aromaticivorans TaxID=1306992 RepID=A0AAV3UAC5_9ALTE
MLHQIPAPAASQSKPFIIQLLWLAIPIAIGIMVQTSYHIINAFWVGKLGAEALAVVSLSFPIQLVLIAVASGLSLATSILIAQRHGAGNHYEINLLAGQSLTGLTLLAVALTALGLLFAPTIVHWLGTDAKLQTGSVLYFRTTLLGTAFVYLNLTYQSILRGLGEAKAPLFIIIPSVVVNALLDPILIFGAGPIPALGVQGAAYATVITQALSALAGVWLLLRPRFGFNIGAAQLRLNLNRQKQILRVGLPASIEQSMGAVTVAVVTALASQYGVVTLASYGVVFRVLSFCLIPGVGVSMAISILVGRHLGAGENSRVGKMAVKTAAFNFCQLAALGSAVFYYAQPIAEVFAPNDTKLQQYATLVLQIVAVSMPFTSIQMAFNGAFRGAGDTLGAMFISLTSVWIYQIPLSLVLSYYTPLADFGLWWATTASAMLIGITAVIYFRIGNWRKKFELI